MGRQTSEASLVSALMSDLANAPKLLVQHDGKYLLMIGRRKFSNLSVSDLEEILNDTVYEATQAIRTYEARKHSGLCEWLSTIFCNNCIDLIRNKKKDPLGRQPVSLDSWRDDDSDKVEFTRRSLEKFISDGYARMRSNDWIEEYTKDLAPNPMKSLAKEFLDSLTERDRMVIVTRDADYSFSEVAKMAGVSESNARQIYSRRKRAFRKFIDKRLARAKQVLI